MKKSFVILILISALTAILFQNCGDIKLSAISNKPFRCEPQTLAIETDNTSSEVVRFLVRDIGNLNAVSSQIFDWTVSENQTEIFSAKASEISVPKSSLVACRTYQVKAVFQNCEEIETLSVDYTLDGPGCAPEDEPPPPPPPEYPPAEPAPPGQQTGGAGCSNGYGNNANFDYANGRYCAADTSTTADLMACRNGGFDFSSSNIKYYPLIKPGKYLAIEVMIPHPFTNGLNKTVCGFHAEGEMGNSCNGSGGAAIDTWAISPNPGDFNPTDFRCVGHTTTTSVEGRMMTNPEIGGCPMDPGRKYYLNITMGNNCTAANGCSFLLKLSGLFSGGTYTIGGQRYTINNSCQLERQ